MVTTEMVDPAILYWGGMIVLFFFWIYGIASFFLDLRNKVLPGIVTLWQVREERKQEAEAEAEREEQERQLF